MHSKIELIDSIKKELGTLDLSERFEELGVVVEIGDGIAAIAGLSGAKMSEMLDFGHGVMGVVLNLDMGRIGAMILGDYSLIKVGDEVKKTDRILEVPVSDALVGRVLNPLGQPIDGRSKIATKTYYPIEKIAPGVIKRKSVTVPLQTGIKSIDAMIPIGRGQRELIIGDRQTGKTALAIDTIINQKGKNVICIYVAIGQKESKIAKIVSKLETHAAMDHTIVIIAGASEPASFSFLAPYAGVAMAEYFMDKGKDVLIIYDDLSKHAVAYRQLSLLLKRPPGREAYPGDIFYLHSRLLERAARIHEDYGGGSITALPIIETLAGDVSAYIPTNVISITDGQIYLETDLFYKGVRPAVNVGLSVSRVGSAAQIKAMKQVAGKLKLSLAQYQELAAFAQFGSELDEATKKTLNRGSRTIEILKQNQYDLYDVEKQVVVLYAVVNGYMDDIPKESVKSFELFFLEYMENNAKEVYESIVKEKHITSDTEKKLQEVINDAKKIFLEKHQQETQ
ncbi:MAG: F0F1 ATP synthase subunit alpha [Parcubacteria group bacterium]|nr:F0F1 ATP synthase subunit alpha [Parcubacteria group bacterium]